MKWETKHTGKLIYKESDVTIIWGIINNETTKDTGKKLFLSYRTIQNRIYYMRKKLKAKSTAELVLLCYLYGVINYEKPTDPY